MSTSSRMVSAKDSASRPTIARSWQSAASTLAFSAAAVWLGVTHRDPFALFYAVLAACCAVAGYGTLVAVRPLSASGTR